MSLHSTFKKISPTTLLKQEDWEGLCPDESPNDFGKNH
ncbi:Vi polysaccharide export protein VexE [Salmonella enterica subsp. enterica serovar Typhi]|nr:Vi polysaccharide export protein VexE [Salmonella enterica subsp. enterica serovar Typhi]